MLSLISLGVFVLSAVVFIALLFNGPIPVTPEGWRKWQIYEMFKTIPSVTGIVAAITFFISLI